VSEAWVHESLNVHSRLPAQGGQACYGYYWWIYPDMYEAWGGAGQRIAIFPKLDIVAVMTADIADDAPVASFPSEIYRYIASSVQMTSR
jgi:CubicO group peptidase (beta-lactamase class C family)